MLQPFRTMLRSPCSNDASVPTIQRFARRSTSWVKPQNGSLRCWPLSPTQSGDARALRAISSPIRLTDPDNPDPPKSFSIASAFPSTASEQFWPHLDLAHQPDELLLPAPNPLYLPKYGVFGHLSSYLHRSREAPFFGCLDTLTIQDSCACLGMTVSGLSHFSAQSVVNALSSSISPPVAKVGVDSLPRRKIMRQIAPLATSAQDIEDGIDNLSAQVISRTPSAFDWRNQRLEDLPFFIG